jgi:acyl carrier protein
MQAESELGARADELMERVVNCVRKLLPRARAKQPLDRAARLRWDLGLDSMQLLELVFLLEEEFDWRASDSDFAGKPIETLDDVADLVRRVLSAPTVDTPEVANVPRA